jgi:hypothetical protein
MIRPIRQPRDEKLRELILLITEWSQADEKFGAIKLNKLLFHCDFAAYLTFGEPITSQQYFALPQGPAPRRLKPITQAMVKSQQLAYKEVSYYGYTQLRPIALKAPNVELFSPKELNLIRNTIQTYWNMSATEISKHSHLFLGWKIAREKETIPYCTALVSCRPPTEIERSHGLAYKELAEGCLRAHR